MPRDDATLLDILKACRLAISFLGDVDRAGFLADPKTQAAVVHELLVLGEAVKRLSPEFTARVSGVPWKAITGMRDKLIHHYDAVDLEQVWRSASVDIPRLQRAASRDLILAELDEHADRVSGRRSWEKLSVPRDSRVLPVTILERLESKRTQVLHVAQRCRLSEVFE